MTYQIVMDNLSTSIRHLAHMISKFQITSLVQAMIGNCMGITLLTKKNDRNKTQKHFLKKKKKKCNVGMMCLQK